MIFLTNLYLARAFEFKPHSSTIDGVSQIIIIRLDEGNNDLVRVWS